MPIAGCPAVGFSTAVAAPCPSCDDRGMEPTGPAQPTESTEPSGPASVEAGERTGKAVSRTLGWRALGLIVLAGAAGFALIVFVPGLDRATRVALSFILAPVVVTPLLGGQAGFSRAALIVGSVLGGEIAALLYGTGQYRRFSAWLIVVELVALLLAPLTLRILRMARVPGVPPGEEMPSSTGIALIVVLAPFALAAALLDGMARFPIAAIIGALLVSVFTSTAREYPVTIVAAALLALAPAGIRWLIVHARRPGK
jgi:hypothetical protein